MHGGRSPAGIASPHFTHGRYSKALPVGLAKKFSAAMSDPDLLSARGAAALLDARLTQLLGQLSESGPAELWRDLKKAWRSLTTANKDGDADAMKAALGEIGKIIDAGAGQDDIWKQIERAIRERTAAATAEHRREIELELVMDSSQARTLFGAIQTAILEEVSDREVLTRIARRFAQLTNIGAPQRYAAPGHATSPPADVQTIDAI